MNNQLLKPLQQFICDDCLLPIMSLEEGWSEWWSNWFKVTSSDDEYMMQLSDGNALKVHAYEESNHEANDRELVDVDQPRFVGYYNFRIVHHAAYSPKNPLGDCYKLFYEDRQNSGRRNVPSLNDSHLQYVIDETLPEWQNTNALMGNIKEFRDFERRLTIPHYEEARRYIALFKREGFMNLMNGVYVGGTSIFADHPVQPIEDSEEILLNTLTEPNITDTEKLKEVIKIGKYRYSDTNTYKELISLIGGI